MPRVVSAWQADRLLVERFARRPCTRRELIASLLAERFTPWPDDELEPEPDKGDDA